MLFSGSFGFGFGQNNHETQHHRACRHHPNPPFSGSIAVVLLGAVGALHHALHQGQGVGERVVVGVAIIHGSHHAVGA